MLSSFTSFNAFLHMGGYALYVWPAYSIFVIVLVIQAMQSRLAKMVHKIIYPITPEDAKFKPKIR